QRMRCLCLALLVPKACASPLHKRQATTTTTHDIASSPPTCSAEGTASLSPVGRCWPSQNRGHRTFRYRCESPAGRSTGQERTQGRHAASTTLVAHQYID